MIVRCEKCASHFDDEFRTTLCPHPTFLANDGYNAFQHYSDSYLSEAAPPEGYVTPYLQLTLRDD